MARSPGGRTALTTLALALLWAAAADGQRPAPAQKADQVRGAHEKVKNPTKTVTDETGLTVPGVPVDHPGRVYPGTSDFSTGPALGERLPDFTLPNQDGQPVDFHADRGGSKAVLVFFRSAVW